MTNQYRKKPVIVEAVQWNGRNWIEIQKWTNHGIASFDDKTLRIATLEGTMTANVGDWIIKGVAGEFYPCKNDIFEATYEPTTNCSRLESGFRAYEVGLKLESKRWLVRNDNDTIMGFITEEDEGLRPIDDSPVFTSASLRQLADLVEATLKGGE